MLPRVLPRWRPCLATSSSARAPLVRLLSRGWPAARLGALPAKAIGCASFATTALGRSPMARGNSLSYGRSTQTADLLHKLRRLTGLLFRQRQRRPVHPCRGRRSGVRCCPDLAARRRVLVGELLGSALEVTGRGIAEAERGQRSIVPNFRPTSSRRRATAASGAMTYSGCLSCLDRCCAWGIPQTRHDVADDGRGVIGEDTAEGRHIADVAARRSDEVADGLTSPCAAMCVSGPLTDWAI